MITGETLRGALRENLDLVCEALILKFSSLPTQKRKWEYIRKGLPKALDMLYNYYLGTPGWGTSKEEFRVGLALLGYALLCESKVEETMEGVFSQPDGKIDLENQMKAVYNLIKSFKEEIEEFNQFQRSVYTYVTKPYLETLKEIGISSSLIPSLNEVSPNTLLQLYLDNKDHILSQVEGNTNNIFKEILDDLDLL